MACDYSEIYVLLAKSMASAILFTAFVQAIQKKKFCYAQKHFIGMLQTCDHCSLQIKCYTCWGMNPAWFDAIFIHPFALSPAL